MHNGWLFSIAFAILFCVGLTTFAVPLPIVDPLILLAVYSVAALVCVIAYIRKSGHSERVYDALFQYVSDLRKDVSQAGAPANMPNRVQELVDELGALGEDVAEHLEQLESMKQREAICSTRLAVSDSAVKQHEETLECARKRLESVSGDTIAVGDALSRHLRSLMRMVAEVEDTTEQQRFQLAETSGDMVQLADNVQVAAGRVRTASDKAEESSDRAREGVEELRGAVDDIENVKSVTLELRDAMGAMEEKTKNIDAVMVVISEVADQTNLLALNAAIEAARAGDAGRGFAVVADEVRKLAEKTMQATTEVHHALSGIQVAANSNKVAVAGAADTIVRSAERASSAGAKMEEIVSNLHEAAANLHDIAAAVEDGLTNTSRVTGVIEEISSIAAGTADHLQSFTSALVMITGGMDELDTIAHSATADGAVPSGPFFQWTPDLDTGISLIDDQHKMLCVYINALYRATQRGDGDDDLKDIVANLRSYTVSHFSTEERYFSRTTYPDTQKHHEVHCKFVDKIIETENSLVTGQVQVGDDLLGFLKDWLLSHIRVTDHQYVPFVKTLIAKEQTARKGDAL